MVQILLCSYNGERYLPAQLDSILSQRTEEDYELLISDDCSGDGTREILRRYRERRPDRVRLLLRESPSGGAWRHFLSLFTEGYAAGADYIMLSDQDDVWEPEKLSESLKAMREMERSCGAALPLLVHCDSRLVDGELREIAPSFTAYQKMSPERDKLAQLLVQNHVVGASVMINRALSERIRTMPERIVMHDQWIALIAAAFGRLFYLPKPLYLYRQHGANVLGAEKGSLFSELFGRLGIGRKDGRSKREMDEHSRAVYAALFEQAESFLRIYGEELRPEQRRLLEDFLRIKEQGRLGKIINILGHGFTYNLLHRTIGELIFI